MGRPLFGTDPSRELHRTSCNCLNCSTHNNLATTSANPAVAPDDAPPHLINPFRPRPSVSGLPSTAGSLQLYEQTRDNLQLASTALEAAYNRLRELRLAIRGMSDSVPLSEPHTQTLDPNSNSTAMGPEHAAIVVADGVTEQHPRGPLTAPPEPLPDSDALRSSLLSSSLLHESLWRSFASPRSSEPAPRSSLPRRTHPFVDYLRDGPETPLQPPSSVPTRRSLLEQNIRNRPQESDSDAAATIIGRRVAARTSAGRSGGPGSSSDVAQSLVDRTAQLASSLERAVDRLMAHRMPHLSREQPDSAGRSRADLTSQEIEDRLSFVNSLGPTPSALRLRFTGPLGLRPTPDTNSHAEHNGDLDMISGVRLAQPGTISPPSVPRPTIFDRTREDLRRLHASDPEEGDYAEQRSYRVRRRFNADGEIVHNVNTESWEDSLDALFPPPSSETSARDRLLARVALADRRRQREAGSHTASSDHRSRNVTVVNNRGDDRIRSVQSLDHNRQRAATRRRRGWARIDPDGNEISTDEEEELERVRTQHRLRLSALRPSHSLLPPSPSEGFVPTTRAAVPEEDLNPAARVRINNRRHLVPPPIAYGGHRSGTDMTGRLRAEDGSRVVFGSAAPYSADPLPMPAEEMMSQLTATAAGSEGMTKGKHAAGPRVVRVSSYKAGR